MWCVPVVFGWFLWWCVCVCVWCVSVVRVRVWCACGVCVWCVVSFLCFVVWWVGRVYVCVYGVWVLWVCVLGVMCVCVGSVCDI